MAELMQSKKDYVRDYVERCKPGIAEILNLKDGDPGLEKFLKIAEGVGSELYDTFQSIPDYDISIESVDHKNRSVSIAVNPVYPVQLDFTVEI